jgi:hypothetical protein
VRGDVDARSALPAALRLAARALVQQRLLVSGSKTSCPSIINTWLWISAMLACSPLLTPAASSLPFFACRPKYSTCCVGSVYFIHTSLPYSSDLSFVARRRQAVESYLPEQRPQYLLDQIVL